MDIPDVHAAWHKPGRYDTYRYRATNLGGHLDLPAIPDKIISLMREPLRIRALPAIGEDASETTVEAVLNILRKDPEFPSPGEYVVIPNKLALTIGEGAKPKHM